MKHRLAPLSATLMSLLLLAGCCPQADCPEPVSFRVQDGATGEPVANLAVASDSGEMVCNTPGGPSYCGGHGGGQRTIRMTLSAPGYQPVEIRGDKNDDDGFCPGCPLYDLFIDGVEVDRVVPLRPEG